MTELGAPPTFGQHFVAPDGKIYPKWLVVTDATWDAEIQMAGIACVRDGYPLNARVLGCPSNNEAELHAIVLAMETLREARVPLAEFRSDARSVVTTVVDGWRGLHPKRTVPQSYIDLVMKARRYLGDPPKGGEWRLTSVDRGYVTPAHTLARLVLKAWKAGRGG